MASLSAVTNVVSLKQSLRCCQHCSLHVACDMGGTDARAASNQKMPGHNSRVVGHGEYLFRQGEKMHALYVIRSGTVKTTISTPDGAEQVVRFYMQGDLVGLDAMGEQYHVSSAQTLETTSVCRFTLEELDASCANSAAARRQLMRLAGQELAREERHAMLISQRDAEQRMAMFLLQLSEQYAQRGYSEMEFNLHMSRQEVASFLSLAVETVSRIFTQFQMNGLVKVERRHIRLLSLEKLRDVAGVSGHPVATKARCHGEGIN